MAIAPLTRGRDSPSWVPVVGQLMSWPVPIVAPDAEAGATLATLLDRGARHALVKSGGRICGVVCRIDLLEASAGEPIVWTMSAPAAIVSSATLVSEAAELIAAGGGCGAAVDAGGSWGFLSGEHARRACRLEVPRCAACGEAHRVKLHESSDTRFCLECAETMIRRELDELFADLGASGTG